mgnify:CR=1 FL=1
MVYTLSSALDHFRQFHIQIGTGITDLSGNSLDASSETSFETLGNVVINPADSEGMILISGGRFMMGADNQTDENAEENEGPVHNVTLTGPFYISDHEVTVGEYKACVDAGGCSEPGSGTYSDNLNLPVNKVSWVQATEFAQWKTSQASKTFRLCTEAEWEYAPGLEPPQAGPFRKMPISRTMPGTTAIIPLHMELGPSRSKQGYRMLLDYTMCTEICGNGSRIMQARITVLMQMG